MALYHKWNVKNDFAYVLQLFLLISDNLGIVHRIIWPQYILIQFEPILSDLNQTVQGNE